MVIAMLGTQQYGWLCVCVQCGLKANYVLGPHAASHTFCYT